jgi:hypothetical protein
MSDSLVSYELTFSLEMGRPEFALCASSTLLSAIKDTAHAITLVSDAIPRIGKFVNDASLHFGFGGIFRQAARTLNIADFSGWKAEVPANATGDKQGLRKAYQLCGTIAAVTRALEGATGPTNHRDLKQLAKVLTSCAPEKHGFGLLACLSPTAWEWICAHRHECHAAALEAMVATAKCMWPQFFRGNKQAARAAFRVWDNASGQGLVLTVPGSATGLGLDHVDDNGWQQFASDNVDSPVQQLALLAGFCTIVRLVRQAELEELAKTPDVLNIDAVLNALQPRQATHIVHKWNRQAHHFTIPYNDSSDPRLSFTVKVIVSEGGSGGGFILSRISAKSRAKVKPAQLQWALREPHATERDDDGLEWELSANGLSCTTGMAQSFSERIADAQVPGQVAAAAERVEQTFSSRLKRIVQYLEVPTT